MLIAYCEECGQQYKFDSDKFAGPSAKVRCRGCNYVFEVFKDPKARRRLPQETALFKTIVEMDQKLEPQKTTTAAAPSPAPTVHAARGLGLTARMLWTFLVLMAVTAGALLSVYFWVVPDQMHRQVRLRTESVARTFATAVSDPVLVRNFLRINQTAEKTAQLPGVAYVAVLNPKEIVVAGIFGDRAHYTSAFLEEIAAKGFPKEMVLHNKLGADVGEKTLIHAVDGKRVLDLAVPIGDTQWEAHVGVFTADVDEAMGRTLQPLLAIFGVMALVGGGAFAVLARTVSRPVKQLCAAAVSISQGRLGQKISIEARGEIGELALALESMRLSICQAVEKLRKRCSA